MHNPRVSVVGVTMIVAAQAATWPTIRPIADHLNAEMTLVRRSMERVAGIELLEIDRAL